MYMLHQPLGDYYGAWRALEELNQEGKIKAIGVCNFYPERLTDLCLTSKVKPAVNQIELHPFFQQENAIENMKEFDVKPQAWGCKVYNRNVGKIFEKRISGKLVCDTELSKLKTAGLLFFAEEYHKRNWTMQIHYGVIRNNNKKMFEILGPDSGYDCIGDNVNITNFIKIMNCLEIRNCLPKTIFYSLNPNDNYSIEAAIGCFQDNEKPSKLQHGVAWWVNDHKIEIRKQLSSLASQGMLCHNVGMLTDSRSFLSYVRHEYYRRIFCDYIGDLVEEGEFPYNKAILKEIV